MASVKRDQIIQEAEKLAARGKFDAAIKEYRRALDQVPNDTNTLNRLGDLLVRVSRIPEAIDVYERIADRFAEDGFFLKAIAIFKKVNRLDPQRGETYEKLGDLYFKQGLVVEGRQQFLTLADWFQRSKSLPDAIRVFRRLIELEPSNFQARAKLVDLLVQSGDTKGVGEELDSLGRSLLGRGMLDEAVKLYHRAVELGPGIGEVVVPCLDALVAAGKHTQALELARKALAGRKGGVELRRAAARAAVEHGDLKLARELLETLLPETGDRTDIVQMYGDVMLRVGESAEAKEHLLPAIDRMVKAGDMGRAGAMVKRLLRSAPGDMDVLEKALKVFDRKNDPDLVSSIEAALADAYFRAQRKQPAIDLYARLAQSDPGNELFNQRLRELGVRMPSTGGAPPATPEPRPQPVQPVSAPAAHPAAPPPPPTAPMQEPAPQPVGAAVEVAPEEFEVVEFDVPWEASTQESAQVEIQPHITDRLPPVVEARPAPEPEASAPPLAENLEELYTEAVVFAKYGLTDKAIAHLQRLLTVDPEHTQGRDLLASFGPEALAAVDLPPEAPEELVPPPLQPMSAPAESPQPLEPSEPTATEVEPEPATTFEPVESFEPTVSFEPGASFEPPAAFEGAAQFEPTEPVERAPEPASEAQLAAVAQVPEQPPELAAVATPVEEPIEEVPEFLEPEPAPPPPPTRPAKRPAPSQPFLANLEEPAHPRTRTEPTPRPAPPQPALGPQAARAATAPAQAPALAAIPAAESFAPPAPARRPATTPRPAQSARHVRLDDLEAMLGLREPEASPSLSAPPPRHTDAFRIDLGAIEAEAMQQAKPRARPSPDRIPIEPLVAPEPEPMEVPPVPGEAVPPPRKGKGKGKLAAEIPPEAEAGFAVPADELPGAPPVVAKPAKGKPKLTTDKIQIPVEAIVAPSVGQTAPRRAVGKPPVLPPPEPPVAPPPPAEEVEVLEDVVEVSEVLEGPSQEQLRELDFCIQQGLLDDAAALLGKIKEYFPDHPEVRNRQALLKARGWDEEKVSAATEAGASELFSEEEKFFDLAAELEKELEDDEMVAQARGAGMAGEASIEDLFREFQRGVAEQVGEQDFDTHFNLGLAYREMGLVDEAIGEFQLSAKSDEYFVESATMIAACYIEKGLPEQASEWYSRAMKSPSLTQETELGLRYELGKAYEAAGKTVEAIGAFTSVLAVNPAFRDVVDRLARLRTN
jgi:pilus assembly protein FimV